MDNNSLGYFTYQVFLCSGISVAYIQEDYFHKGPVILRDELRPEFRLVLLSFYF